MRSMFAVVLLVSGCANDSILVDPNDDPADDPIIEPMVPADPADPTVEPRIHAKVCEYRAYPSVKYDSLDVDLAVTATPTGATIFNVARRGGAIRAVQLDGRGNLVGDRAGTIVSDDRAYTAVSASYLDERLVTAGLVGGDDEAVFSMHRFDFGQRIELERTRASLLPESAMLPAQGDRIAAFADEANIHGIRFGADWGVSDLKSFGRSDLESLSSAQFLGDAALTWSTADTCHVQQLSGGTERHAVEREFACQAGRMAIDPKFNTGKLVFESNGSILIAGVTVMGQGQSRVRLGDAQVIADQAYSPRISWDGERYWIAYLDPRGYPLVGFLEADGNLRKLGIQTLPMDQAFELTTVAGQVWLYQIDRLGLTGAHLCTEEVAPPPTPRG